MKLLLLTLAAIALCSCAQTVVRHSTGYRLLHTQADAQQLDYVFRSPVEQHELHIRNLSHSEPTIAQGKAAQGKINAIGAGLALLAAKLFTKGLF